MWATRKNAGFTIVELLIVVVVIGILAAVVVVAYNGVQNRAKVAKVGQDMAAMNKQILSYHAINGSYPATTSGTLGSGSTIMTDENCTPSASRTSQWVPNLNTTLPQSDQSMKGVGNNTGCYVYVSNGTDYILSAWNMLPSPQTDAGYRRLGFRESGFFSSAQYYLCNHATIGGGATYNANNDYYKRSITYTSISTCNETPPTGA